MNSLDNGLSGKVEKYEKIASLIVGDLDMNNERTIKELIEELKEQFKKYDIKKGIGQKIIITKVLKKLDY